MRKRLYKGVVKRACDDPGCDREWPCERHASQREIVARAEDWQSRQGKAGLFWKDGVSLAEQCEFWRTFEDDDVCADCGYTVCTCPEEDVITAVDVVNYAHDVLWLRDVRSLTKDGERYTFSALRRVEGERVFCGVSEADVREWKAKREEPKPEKRGITSDGVVSAYGDAAELEKRPAQPTLLERVRAMMAVGFPGATMTVTSAELICTGIGEEIRCVFEGETPTGKSPEYFHCPFASLEAFERSQKPEPSLLERVQAFTDSRVKGVRVMRILDENEHGRVRFECEYQGKIEPGWVDISALQAFGPVQKPKPEPVTREDLDAYLSAHTSWSRVEQVARDEAKQRYTYFGFMGSSAYPTWTNDDEVRAWKAQRAAEAKRNADIVAAVYGSEMVGRKP